MRQLLPVGEYSWCEVTEELVAMFQTLESSDPADWALDPDRDSHGYALEVTLGYPDHLHSRHASNPLAPEKRIIRGAELSPYAQTALRATGQSVESYERTKLTATFHRREYYVVHFKTLALYLRLGMKLEAVHRVLKFRQLPWLREYVDRMTAKRQEAKHEFKRWLMKLLINR